MIRSFLCFGLRGEVIKRLAELLYKERSEDAD